MNDNSTFISPQEKILYKEIESYRESQKQLKNIIENNIQAELELYLINDECLNQWKQYSCYDELKISSLSNVHKWREIRTKKNAEKIKLQNINNKNLFQKNNDNFTTINSNAYFHFMNENCFDTIFKDKIDNNEIFKMKFSSFNNKIIGQYNDKILVLYKNNESLNLLMFVLEDCNDQICFNHIKESNMKEYLLQNKIEDNIEQCEIINDKYNCEVKYINKSFQNIKKKSKEFKELISSLINFDYQFNSLLKQNDNMQPNFFLINEEFIEKLKLKLRYVDWLNEANNTDLNATIKKIFKDPAINLKETSNLEIINQNIINYLKENNNDNIIKFFILSRT